MPLFIFVKCQDRRGLRRGHPCAETQFEALRTPFLAFPFAVRVPSSIFAPLGSSPAAAELTADLI
jgi:hypothetical protein